MKSLKVSNMTKAIWCTWSETERKERHLFLCAQTNQTVFSRACDCAADYCGLSQDQTSTIDGLCLVNPMDLTHLPLVSL